MIRTAIFDMDGLMFDTELLYVRSLEEYVGPKTGVAFPRESILKTLGCNHADFERIFPELFGTEISFSACYAMIAEWMTREIEAHGVPVKPGLYELLDALKKDGIRIALATGTSRPIALEYLKRTDTRKYFDAFAFGDQVTRGKPDPEIFLLACRLLSGSPETTVVFEDSVNGLRAAHAGGFHAVCVPDLIDPVPRLDFVPDAKLSVLSDAIPLIRRWNSPHA
ncbi:MAG: HAD family phosphatase [Clostridia bacterium]|nr:HAD family phosphatase [Clostridia bacterium]